MTDIYSLDFNPNILSSKQEELGLSFADDDTAVELMKKEEKMLIAELTLEHSKNSGYKNMTELNGYIYSDEKFKQFTDRYRLFVTTSELKSLTKGNWLKTYRKEFIWARINKY